MYPFDWLKIAGGAFVGFMLAFGLHEVDMYFVDAAHARDLASLKVELQAECDADKKITQEANYALHKQMDDVARKLAAAKRMRPSRCIVPSSNPAGVIGSGGQHAGQDGISSDWLRDYAAECEIYRQERVTLDKFIADERDLLKVK